jgi:peptidoglycan/LPS O-acetylase OafA/YrhL
VPVSIDTVTQDSANLNLIRAVAVLCVACSHFYETLLGRSDVAWHFAQMGVLIFFVHTACVLMLSLERSAVKVSHGAALLRDFYIRRAFRIYPLSLVVVTLAVFGWTLRPGDYDITTFLANFTLTMNLVPTPYVWPGLWTLPIEMQMYLVLPLLFLWLRDRPSRLLLGLFALACGVGSATPYISQRLDIFEYAPCFLAGVLAWHVSRRVRPRLSSTWWPLAFALTWPIWLIAPREGRVGYRWAFCLALGLLIPHFRQMTWRPLTWPTKQIATYSYGIYLTHGLMLAFALQFDGPVRVGAFIIAALALPMAAFHAIEDPMIRVGRRLADRVAVAGRGRFVGAGVAGSGTEATALIHASPRSQTSVSASTANV